MPILNIKDVKLKGKRVLIREDLNVPFKKNGDIIEITSDARIRAIIPTIEYALKQGALVMIASHLGRPDEGVFTEELSLAPVAKRLEELLGKPVELVSQWLQGVTPTKDKVLLLENVRFNRGEKANDKELSQKMADLCDVFVMDAFATAHRVEASTCGIAEVAKVACAGPLLMQELDAISALMEHPKKPVVAIVGGSKVSTKLALLNNLMKKADVIIVGGGIANTFIAATGYSVGKSLYEPDLIDEAEALMKQAKALNVAMPIPTDVVVADKMSNDAESYIQLVTDIDEDEKILDIGPDTIRTYVKLIKSAGTILWNGPVGAFEIEQFAKGTKILALAIADSGAFSVAGGGDTLAAIEHYNVSDKISYISTGGGAFLALLEGKELPAITALQKTGTKK